MRMERHCIYYVIWGSSLKTRNGFAGHVIRLLGFTAYSFTNPLRRGGPLRPPVPCRIIIWFWMLGITSCSFTSSLRRGGPLCPPAPVGFSFGFGNKAARRVRLRPSPRRPGWSPAPAGFLVPAIAGMGCFVLCPFGLFPRSFMPPASTKHAAPPTPSPRLRISWLNANPLRRGGPPCPPVPAGFPFGFGYWASRRARFQILCVGGGPLRPPAPAVYPIGFGC